MHQKILYLIVGGLLGIIVMQSSMPQAQGQATRTAFEEISTRKLVLIDEEGKERVVLGTGSMGIEWRVLDKAGDTIILLYGNDGGGVGFLLGTDRRKDVASILMFAGGSEADMQINSGPDGKGVEISAKKSGVGEARIFMKRRGTTYGQNEQFIDLQLSDDADVTISTDGRYGVEVHRPRGMMESSSSVTLGIDPIKGGVISTTRDDDNTGEFPIANTARKPTTWGQIKDRQKNGQ